MRIVIAVVIVIVILFIVLTLFLYGAEDRTNPGMKRKDTEQMQSLGIGESDKDEEILR